MSLGFVHACEQNHLNLSIIGGGGVVQLTAGKVVTCPVDPLFVYNFAFGVRLAYDAAGAEAAFKRAGRDYVHVLASPSSRPGLGDDLARLGYAHVEDQAYRRTAGTGSGAPGLLELGDGRPESITRPMATKAADVEGVLGGITPLLRPDDVVMPFQNGLGAGERLRKEVPADAEALTSLARAGQDALAQESLADAAALWDRLADRMFELGVYL